MASYCERLSRIDSSIVHKAGSLHQLHEEAVSTDVVQHHEGVVSRPGQAYAPHNHDRFNVSPATSNKDSNCDDGATDGSSSPPLLSVGLLSVPAQAFMMDCSKRFGPYKGIETNMSPLSGSTCTLYDEKSQDGGSPAPGSLKHYQHSIATSGELESLKASSRLPPLTGRALWREMRYSIATAYRRMWALVIAVNICVMATMVWRAVDERHNFTYGLAATAVSANLVVSALMRHEHTINMLFKLACALPNGTPLFIRRHAAKVYTYGGVHSGCGVSAFLWYIFYTVLIIRQFDGSKGERAALAATCAATLVLFSLIIGLAYPTIRMRRHNQWELSHRYCGWAAVALVWAQILIITIVAAKQSPESTGTTLVRTPAFWFLVVITLCLIYPWLRLRRRAVTPETLSPHATRLHFNDTTLRSCVAYRLSHNPLRENHGFATIPNPEAAPGYSILVSHAGDWTRAMIDNPPKHVWTRGAPTTGVMRVATLFKPCIVIATGSGIGPCLSFLQCYPDHPLRVIWSARHPEETYGPEIMRAVFRADPNALLVDTKKTGHPDLVALSWALKEDVGAEAAIVISNPKVTKMVTNGLEMRGFPAFGAVFDS